MKSRVLPVLLIGLGVLAIVPVARLGCLSRRDLNAGAQAEAAGLRRVALIYYERAARCYFPGNHYANESLRHLAALSKGWEQEDQVAYALAAAESLRGILLATGAARWHPDLMLEASGFVARLRPQLVRLWPDEKPAAGPDRAVDVVLPSRKSNPRALPAIAGMACFWSAVLLALMVPRRWEHSKGAGPGLRMYLASGFLLVVAMALFSLA